MLKRITTLFVFCFVVGLANSKGQAEQLAENFDYGKIEKNIYHNSFFKLAIPVDSTWFVQNKELVERLASAGSEMVAGDNKTLKAAIKAAQVNTAYLLTVFKYEIGSPVMFNPSFIVVAENTKNAPGIKRGSDYLFHAKTLLQQSEVEYSFGNDFAERKIGSKIFDIMEARMSIHNKAIIQDYISTIINGFCLSFILTYTNEEEKNELYSILEKTVL